MSVYVRMVGSAEGTLVPSLIGPEGPVFAAAITVDDEP